MNWDSLDPKTKRVILTVYWALAGIECVAFLWIQLPGMMSHDPATVDAHAAEVFWVVRWFFGWLNTPASEGIVLLKLLVGLMIGAPLVAAVPAALALTLASVAAIPFLLFPVGVVVLAWSKDPVLGIGALVAVTFILGTLAHEELQKRPELQRRLKRALEHVSDAAMAILYFFVRGSNQATTSPNEHDGLSRRTAASEAAEEAMADSVKEHESQLKVHAARVAELVPEVGPPPVDLAGYEGWFKEGWKRVQLRSLARTRDEALHLLRQSNEMYGEVIKLKRAQTELGRAQSEFGRLDKEAVVKDLELAEREAELRTKLAKHAAELAEVQGNGKRRPAAPRFDPAAEMTRGIRDLASLNATEAKLKNKHPDQTDAIEKWAEKIREEIMEGRQRRG